MSYPPPRSRSSSAADRYRPDDYPPARASPPQAPQANGYLAPGGSPPTAPLAMPEPYQPSPLSNGASNGPAFQPHSLPTHSNSYLHPHGGTPGAPPYPLADPSPRPRSYSNSSQRSYHSQRSGSRRSSHGQQQAQQVRFDDEPEYFEARRPAHTGHRHSHSGASGRRDESPRHHHHHHRREEDYDDDYDRHHHHSSSGHSHSHHGRHDSFADDNGGKPLKRTDTHRPTLGDTVVSLVSGLKDYVSR